MTWEAQKMHLKIFGRNSLCPGGGLGGWGVGGGPKMKNAQNDMGSPKNAFKNFRPKLPLPRWGVGGLGVGGGPKMKNAQNDMGSPKNAFKNFRPKFPLPIGHSHYACARYAIEIRIAFLF